MTAIPAIEQGIGRAGIEAIHPARVARQYRDIGDAAEVQHHSQGAGFGKQRLMEGGHQRRPLTAEGHVHGTKVGDNVDAGQRRQQGRVADLQGKAELGAVADGLTVAADGANILGGQPCLGQQRVSGGGKLAGHQIIGHPHAIDFVVARGAELVQLAGGRPGVADGRFDPQFIPVHHHQHGIDPVHAGAGHQPNVALNHEMSLFIEIQVWNKGSAFAFFCGVVRG